MGKRSKGRTLLLQAMYAARISGRPLDECLDEQLARRESAPETATFARALGRVLDTHGAVLESRLPPLLEHWDITRVGLVERLILLLGLAELHHSPEVPHRVVINEACELARAFCDENAVRFVNGVLDRAAHDVAAEAGDA